MGSHVALVLTAHLNDGGKFQYSLSMLDAVCALHNQGFRVSIIHIGEHWSKYIPSACGDVYECEKGLFGRAIRKALLYLPFGLRWWRVINRYVHPFHRLLARLSPGLVIYAGNEPLVYESRLPCVAPVFDLMHRYEPSFPEVSADGLGEERDAHYRKVCEHAKAILVDSEIGKKHVIECYAADAKKIFVLPYVAPSYIRHSSGESDVLKKFHLPERYIFYPAQLWKHKNHIGLLRALSLLRQKGLIVNAVFTGSRENGADEVFETIKELALQDQIFYLAYVDESELVFLYKNAVALVMPTFFGPTNIPPLEAFALGCPVLTSNVYDIPKQLGKAGLLFDPRNVADIANKIELVWKDDGLREQLIARGHKRDSEWNQAAFNSRLLSITEEIL